MKRFTGIIIGTLLGVWIQQSLTGSPNTYVELPFSRMEFVAQLQSEASVRASATKLHVPQLPNFEEYASHANLYLGRPRFRKTTLTGELLAAKAQKVWEEQGILIPVELALAQAQLESAFGTRGKSAVSNPFNLGENDHGTTIVFETQEQGVQRYFEVMASDYLSFQDVEQLSQNFVNKRNKRYATSQDYERKLRRQMKYIKRYIANHS